MTLFKRKLLGAVAVLMTLVCVFCLLLIRPRTSVPVTGKLSQKDVTEIGWMVRAHVLSRPALFSDLSASNAFRFPRDVWTAVRDQPTRMSVNEDGTVEVKTSAAATRFTATNMGPAGWSWWNAYP
jgi:hypothetical protein